MNDFRANFLLPLLAVVAILFPAPSFAEGERIDAFHVQIELEPNGSALVQEEIIYNFGENATDRHGIYRQVPLVFTVPGEVKQRTIEISSVMVTDGEGKLLQAEYTGGGNFMQLKIGEKDVSVSGRKRYVIRYTVWGGINQSLPDKDEFYWNATGYLWDVPVDTARVDVVLPIPLQEGKISSACYEGREGSTKRCVTGMTPQEGTGIVTAVRFTYDGSFERNEGMTIAVGIPKGIYAIPPPSHVKTLAQGVGVYHWWRSDFFGLSALFPVLVFIIMFRIWWTNGRDPKGRGAIVAEYQAPEDLSPLALAYLLHNNLPPSAISATIVDLAVRGFLSIERVTTKVLFIENEDFRITFAKGVNTSVLDEAEKKLFDTLHSHGETFLVSSLAHKLTTLGSTLGDGVAKELTMGGYYAENPILSQRHYFIAGLVFLGMGMFLPFANLALVGSGVVICVFAFLMPKRTVHGALVLEQIKGFKEYLAVAEKDRINFANAPEKNPETFERFLPYAMVFGVEKAWAGKFANMYSEKDAQHWYRGGAVNTTALVESLGAFNSHTTSAFASTGGASSGGGHAGGGAGGGGGGSW